MPTYFEFKSRTDDDSETRAELDHKICEALGMKEDDEIAVGFDYVGWIGIFMLWETREGVLTQEIFDQYLIKKPDLVPKEHVSALRKFLYEDYEFKAWYERKVR